MTVSTTRRQFLRQAGLAPLAFSGWRNLRGVLRPVPANFGGPIFTTVTPEQSKITWIHDNAMSPMHYLPESMCSGCAFLDFDQDGWMDIFLVNTGACDFFHPKHPPHNVPSPLLRNSRLGRGLKMRGMQ